MIKLARITVELVVMVLMLSAMAWGSALDHSGGLVGNSLSGYCDSDFSQFQASFAPGANKYRFKGACRIVADGPDGQSYYIPYEAIGSYVITVGSRKVSETIKIDPVPGLSSEKLELLCVSQCNTDPWLSLMGAGCGPPSQTGSLMKLAADRFGLSPGGCPFTTRAFTAQMKVQYSTQAIEANKKLLIEKPKEGETQGKYVMVRVRQVIPAEYKTVIPKTRKAFITLQQEDYPQLLFLRVPVQLSAESSGGTGFKNFTLEPGKWKIFGELEGVSGSDSGILNFLVSGQKGLTFESPEENLALQGDLRIRVKVRSNVNATTVKLMWKYFPPDSPPVVKNILAELPVVNKIAETTIPRDKFEAGRWQVLASVPYEGNNVYLETRHFTNLQLAGGAAPHPIKIGSGGDSEMQKIVKKEPFQIQMSRPNQVITGDFVFQGQANVSSGAAVPGNLEAEVEFEPLAGGPKIVDRIRPIQDRFQKPFKLSPGRWRVRSRIMGPEPGPWSEWQVFEVKGMTMAEPPKPRELKAPEQKVLEQKPVEQKAPEQKIPASKIPATKIFK